MNKPAKNTTSSRPTAQQAVVQIDELGFYPFNSLAATALSHDQAHMVIRNRSSDEQPLLDGENQLKVGRKTIALADRVGDSLTDAFYRGKLPEVIMVTSSMSQIPQFLEELLDYLEKLCSLGFITSTSKDDSTPLDAVIPQFVLCSYGMVYDLVYTKVATALDHMNAYNSWQQDRILQKFCRGYFHKLPADYYRQLWPIQLYKDPLDLVLAGDKSMYTLKVTQLCQNLGINCTFNPNNHLGITELELGLAYHHLCDQLLPRLKKHKRSGLPSKKDFGALFDALGTAMGIIPGIITQAPAYASPTETPDTVACSFTDQAMLYQLKQQLDTHDLTQWVEPVQAMIETMQATAS
ncbi:MAG: hypothetical protein KC476_11750 [Cyanobacteria bacterium HKST-UBA06]|nr:hypothetical protein [Cyanobacteria bacterium HKST-UBA06]MCA9842280.1 hypothetical protein [Cyanobacteria bacterium HKST-UBA03]